MFVLRANLLDDDKPQVVLGISFNQLVLLTDAMNKKGFDRNKLVGWQASIANRLEEDLLRIRVKAVSLDGFN